MSKPFTPVATQHNANLRTVSECREHSKHSHALVVSNRVHSFSKHSHALVVSNREKGVATLPVVFALLILTIAVGMEIAAITVTQNLISSGQHESSQALLYADTGARDALMKIARDKTYSCAGAGCYTIAFVVNGCTQNEGCARIEVDTDAGTTANPKTITSEGRVGNVIRRVQIDVIFDEPDLNGEIVTTTWSELTN